MTNSLAFRSLLLAVKSVRQKQKASVELLWLLDEFRRMVNVCIAIGIEENVSSLKALSLRSYHRLSREMLGYYRLGAIGTAAVILHNYRKAKRKNPPTRIPWARKLMLTTCYGFKVKDGLLRLPVKPRQYIHLNLNNHTFRVLSGVDVRSVTLTPHSLSMTYSKDRVEIKPKGYVGVDRNLDNVTFASTDQTVRTFDLSKATRIASDYRYVKSRFKRNDARIRARVYSKYGREAV
jgi:putative transposase